MLTRTACIVLLIALQLENIEAECYHEKLVYANGEQLQLSNEECKTCYCREGKIQCTDVICFLRTDCEAKIVPGKCCPTYDHCSPKETSSSLFINEAKPLFMNINKEMGNMWTPNKMTPDLNERSINTTPNINSVKIDVASEDNPTKHNSHLRNTNIQQGVTTSTSIIGIVKSNNPRSEFGVKTMVQKILNNLRKWPLNSSQNFKLKSDNTPQQTTESLLNKDEKNSNISLKATKKDANKIIDEVEVRRKAISKRENLPQHETDEIFRQLEIELNQDNTERIQTEDEERSESDQIFRELIDETNTPKSTKKGDKDSDSLQGITDIIAKLTLRGKKNSLDSSNILGVLTNVFAKQYNRYST